MEQRGYEYLRTLGTGASAEVLLVRQGNTKFAVKRIKGDEFQREIEILRSMPTHPCVVGLKEAFTSSEGTAHLVLQYCDGGDLYTYLNGATREISEQCGLDWALQVSLGLSFLHSQKIAYRDLKSLNIFLTRAKNQFYADGRKKFFAVLGDYGVSKRVTGKKDLLTTQVGTPFNMSPEIYLGQPYTFKNDVWALGCVICEIFTGKCPFEAESFLGVRKRVLYDQPTLSRTLGEETRTLLVSLLNKDPDKRPHVREIFRFSCLTGRIAPVLESYGSANPEAQAQIVRQLCELGAKDLVPDFLFVQGYKEILRKAIEGMKRVNTSRVPILSR